MAKPITELYSVLYELTRKLTHLKPSCSNPLRFTSFCPIHGKEKISDVVYWIDNKDSVDIHVRCKVCGDLTIDDVLNPKPKTVAVITDNLTLIEELNLDYSGFDGAAEIKAGICRIKSRLKRSVNDIMEIGRELITLKELLPHGQFSPCLKAEFELSIDTAQNFMNSWERFGKNGIIPNLNPTALYLLAEPSTPDEVIDLALETAAKGEKVSVAEVKEWKKSQAKPSKGKPTAKPKQAEPAQPAIVETATPVSEELPDLDNSTTQSESVEPSNEADEKHLAFKGKQSTIHWWLNELLNSTGIANKKQVQILKKHLDWNLFESKYDHNLSLAIDALRNLLENLPAIIEILEDLDEAELLKYIEEIKEAKGLLKANQESE